MNRLFFQKVFKNEPFKSKRGVVYVDPVLAEELIDILRTTSNKYRRQLLKIGKELEIIVVNALSGTLPLALREAFPEARIVCVEFFPFEIQHLSNMGFEVVDLQMDLDNFNMAYINHRLQRKMKKVDVVCGNPPYQPSENENTKTIWPKFLEQAFELCTPGGYVAFITPRTWTTNALYQSVFLSHDPIHINIDECKKYFPGVGSTFSYYILVNQPPTKHQIRIVSESGMATLDALPLFGLGNPHPLALSIIDKMTTRRAKFEMITSSGYNTMKFSKNDPTVSRTRTKQHKHRVLHKTKDGKDEFFYSNLLDVKEHQVPRVIVNIWVANYAKMVVSDTLLTCEQYRHFPTKTLQEAEVLRELLLTPPYEFLARSLVSGGSFTSRSLSQFPAISLSKRWSMKALQREFGFTEEEISYIRNTIK